jgi:hypothetical protein
MQLSMHGVSTINQPNRSFMARHLLSFARSPIGYIVNLLATCFCHAPQWLEELAEPVMASLCEQFCARDGVQDDMLF